MRKILGIVALASLSTAAFAQVPEIELNNAHPGQPIPLYNPFGAVAIDGSLGSGDVDYYSFLAVPGDYITAAIYDLDPETPDADRNDGNEQPADVAGDFDSLLGVISPGGAIFDFDDDGGLGTSRLSAIHFTVTTPGIWSLAVSGFGDADFNGTGHSENHDYKLVVGVNPIPEPASLGLLALGALAFIRRR